MNTRFLELLVDTHTERMLRERKERASKKELGEDVYTMFCVWCHANKISEEINNTDIFKKYLEETQTYLTYSQRRHLAIKYFGFKEDAS